MLVPLYKTLLSAATPLLEKHLQKRAKAGREDLARLNERRGRPSRPRGDGPLVWAHGASLGEAISLLALVKRLLEDYPGIEVMVTTGTVGSAKVMQERLPPGAFHQFMPLDHPAWVSSFLDHWRPDFVVWVESELWPAMLSEIKKRDIPAALVNARMSPKSFAKWKHAKGIISGILSVFKITLAQNAAEYGRYKALGAPGLKLSANLKYAAAPLPFDEAKLSALQKAAEGREIILFASTHAGEEEVALRLHRKLKDKHPKLLTVILPRHVVRAPDVLELARREGFAAAMRSEELPRAEHEIYVSDSMGEMGIYYRFPKLVVMGGSFADIGGHNPIEPAQLGRVVFYGPLMYNFTGICEDFESRGAALRLSGEEDLLDKVSAFLADPSSFDGMAKAAAAWTAETAHVISDISGDLAAVMPASVTRLKRRGAA